MKDGGELCRGKVMGGGGRKVNGRGTLERRLKALRLREGFQQ